MCLRFSGRLFISAYHKEYSQSDGEKAVGYSTVFHGWSNGICVMVISKSLISDTMWFCDIRECLNLIFLLYTRNLQNRRDFFRRVSSERRQARSEREARDTRYWGRPYLAPDAPLVLYSLEKRKKKIAPVHGCVWVSRKSILACYTLRYNVSLGNIVSFESKKDYHVVVLRQLCVRNEVYS